MLGLAWGNINTVQPTPVKTPVENMIAQSDIPATAQLFTVYLSSVKDQNDPDGDESFYTFGAIDQDLVTRSGQQIAYTPVDNSQGFWMYQSPSMTVNGKSFATSGNTAILDTGTTLSLVSDEVLQNIYSQISGAKYDNTQQGWLIPTADVASRPAVTFAIGDTQFTIEREQLAWQAVDDTMSYGAIQSRGSLTFDIMGDTMLMCIYAVSISNLIFQAPADHCRSLTSATSALVLCNAQTRLLMDNRLILCSQSCDHRHPRFPQYGSPASVSSKELLQLGSRVMHSFIRSTLRELQLARDHCIRDYSYSMA